MKISKLKIAPITIISILFLSVTSFAQQLQKKDFVQPYLTIGSCDKQDCLDKAVIKGIQKVIPETSLISHLEKEEFYVSIGFVVNNDGIIFKESITADASDENYETDLEKWISSLSNINPIQNENGIAILEYYTKYIKFYMNQGEIAYKEFDDQSQFAKAKGAHTNFIPPIYPGCESYTDNIDNLKKCLSNNVKVLVSKKMKINKATKNLKGEGSFRTFIFFKVNKEGVLADVKCYSQTPEMKKEALRTLKSVKKMTPAIHKGVPVNVLYSLPITLRLE